VHDLKTILIKNPKSLSFHEIPRFSCDRKFNFDLNKNLLLDTIMSQLYPLFIPPSYFCEINLTLPVSVRIDLSKIFSFRFS
jgi:hypothetical protein